MTDQKTQNDLDETTDFRPKFGPDGLIAVATTDVASNQLLMVAYMNEEALDKTLETGDAWYWSRSRQKLWRKGETSGNVQSVKEIRVDCDQDTIELVVEQTGAACHTGRANCFYRTIHRSKENKTTLHFTTDQ